MSGIVAWAVWLRRPPGTGEIRCVCECKEDADREAALIAYGKGGTFIHSPQTLYDERLPTTWVEPIRFVPKHPLTKLAEA